MKHRLALLALGAGLAVAAVAPAAPAQAFYCNPQFQVVCDAVAAGCRATGKVGVHCTFG